MCGNEEGSFWWGMAFTEVGLKMPSLLSLCLQDAFG